MADTKIWTHAGTAILCATGIALGTFAFNSYNNRMTNRNQSADSKYSHIPQVTYVQTSPTEGLTLIAPHNTNVATSGPVSIYIRTNEKYQPKQPLQSLDEMLIPQNSIVTIVVDTKDQLAIKYAQKIAPGVPTRTMDEYVQTHANDLASAVAPIKGSIDAKVGPF